MTPSALRSLASNLREVSRYVGANWFADTSRCTRLSDDLLALAVRQQMVPNIPSFELLHRLAGNLRAGVRLAVTTPVVLRAYLVNAAAECEGLAERVERATQLEGVA